MLSGPELLAGHHELGAFDCGVDALDFWLRRRALPNQASGASRTFVVCEKTKVIGYYALASGAVEIAAAPGRFRRNMPDPVPVVLLARLALARSEQGRKLGGHLLVDALRRCVRGGREFGARAIVVDAIDEEAAAFDEHFGFHELEGHRLWRRLTDVAKALGLQS